jgi:tetratricopeptide (TPR) repeat protein
VWLAVLRNHQGRPEEALALVEQGAVDDASLRHPFVLPQALFARTFALGLLGRSADALEVLEEWRDSLDDLGPAGERYRPAFHNFSAWILRATGRAAEAQAHSEAALVEGRTGDEPRNQACLDLAAAALEVGDRSEAVRHLDRLVLDDGIDSTMGWHQHQRRELLLARLALLDGEPDRAAALADAVVADARGRGAPRHGWLAEVVVLLALAQRGGPVDSGRVDAALAGLDRTGVLEAWRASAELGAALGREDLRVAAESRAEAVVAGAGKRGAEVRTWLAAQLRAMA